MKTRRRVIKTPAKGRRSSIICVKKSPIIKRNTRRNTKNVNKKIKFGTYESPLKHLQHIGSPTNLPSTSANSVNQQLKKENQVTKKEKNEIIDVDLELSSNSLVNTVQTEELKKEDIKKGLNEQNDTNINIAETSTSSKRDKRKFSYLSKLNDVPNSKQRKVKKSPLSKINESNDSNILTDNSVIIVDDSELKPSGILLNPIEEENTSHIEPVRNNLHVEHAKSIESYESKSIITDPVKDPTSTQLTGSNEDVVLIDCDSSLMEMDAYHEAFVNQGINTPSPNKANFMDSIIIIDPDESPVQTRNPTPKPNEDCFVVWSSLPQPCTSNIISDSEPQRPIVQPLTNNNLDLFKHNKILLDTHAEYSNLRLLNNENNKPTARKLLKSPKVTTRNPRAARTTTKVAARTASRATMKTTATTLVRKKAKNNGELIFLSESREEDETSVKKKKSKKGKLREIVIDGSNAAMAYTNNKSFSEKGIKMLIDYFTKKGHTVKVFVPQHRRSRNFPLLEKWHTDGIVVFTPSRKLGAKSFTPYDDRYILEYATACDGIVVSQDQFRDLYAEKPQYRDTIENRLLVPTFVGDYVMFPEDPLGRDGPTLSQFLKH